ncbi:MAG: type II toxin-antitoxin system RelE/ParE family toxin [Actinomycetia bacterium]|nr:type II toxin-antitoxin system RelE/ParE family toxin [Actinomycetes bacterium]
MWRVEYAPVAADQMRKLDRTIARRVRRYMDAVIASGQPRARGQGLSGRLAGYWRYRIGDYRVIAEIQDGRLVVLALDLGHRSEIYRHAD